jgi:hypothetical protein
MSNQLGEMGWQRFLAKLRQLLGKSGYAVLRAAAASTTDTHGASRPGASGKTPAPSPGGP